MRPGRRPTSELRSLGSAVSMRIVGRHAVDAADPRAERVVRWDLDLRGWRSGGVNVVKRPDHAVARAVGPFGRADRAGASGWPEKVLFYRRAASGQTVAAALSIG